MEWELAGIFKILSSNSVHLCIAVKNVDTNNKLNESGPCI